MHWKNTAVLLALVIGLGAYISLYELKQPTLQEEKRHSKQAVNLNADSVTQITIDFPKAKTTLTRAALSWTITPANTRADSDLISEILSSLSPLSSKRVLSSSSDKPLLLNEFGLEPAVGSLSLTANSSVTTILFGNPTPVGSARYIKVAGKPEIFIIGPQLFGSLDIPTEDFRDTKLFRLNSRLCQSIELKSSDASWQVLQSGEGWQLTQPFAEKADPVEISRYISSIGSLKIEKFIHDSAAVEALAQWGLDKPRTELIIQAGESPATTSLLFGASVAEDASLVYAKRNDEDSVYGVSAQAVEGLLKKPEALKLKTRAD